MSESSEFTALRDVLAERKRQDMKWGEQNHDPFLYLTILGEEYGETCQAALQARFLSDPDPRLMAAALEDLRNEAVQTAAVALAIVECLDRGKWGWSVAATNSPANDRSHPTHGRLVWDAGSSWRAIGRLDSGASRTERRLKPWF